MKRLAGYISAMAMVFTVACAQTDAGITTAVKTKLAADDTVKAYQVDVDTSNHVVTLKGDVNTSVAKERAVEIARNTDGVRDVIDQLRVLDTAATSGRLDDENLTIKVDDNVKSEADKAADAAKRGATATKNGAEKALDKTVETTKKAGEKTKDVFTDKDRDSDKDGH